MSSEPERAVRLDEDQLYGRLALLSGAVSPDLLRRALGEWAAGGASRRIGLFLVERGWIGREADEALQAEVDRRRRAFEYARRRQRDISLARIALEKRILTVGQVNEAIREQHALEAKGQRFYLGQILVKHGLIPAGRFVDLARELARLDLYCESCDRRYHQEDTSSSGEAAPASCPKCREPLLYPGAPEPDLLDSPVEPASDSGAGERAHEFAARVDDEGVYQLVDLTLPREIGPYQVTEELARGGMGIIYAGRDPRSGEQVAIKVLKDGESAKDADLRRFHHEIEGASRLAHPNIVAVRHSGVHQGTPYYIMDFIQGRTLRQRLRSRDIGVTEAIRLLAQAARAVDYAHSQGVIHRDLKPSNLLVDLSGNCLVADFGLAKFRFLTNRTLTRAGDTIGTPYYMPPEQVSAKPGEIDHRADVYSLGAILYQVLAGEPPFTGQRTYEILEKVKYEEPVPPSRRRPDVSPDLEAIALLALEKEPKKRYDTAREMAEDLEAHLAGKKVRAKRRR
ncbi:MAG: serine/threonine protein kinase [Planctomycetes bacterium]|nr:serine/threonine protein kinase [Planctomycetota bacterium]